MFSDYTDDHVWALIPHVGELLLRARVREDLEHASMTMAVSFEGDEEKVAYCEIAELLCDVNVNVEEEGNVLYIIVPTPVYNRTILPREYLPNVRIEHFLKAIGREHLAEEYSQKMMPDEPEMGAAKDSTPSRQLAMLIEANLTSLGKVEDDIARLVVNDRVDPQRVRAYLEFQKRVAAEGEDYEKAAALRDFIRNELPEIEAYVRTGKVPEGGEGRGGR